MSGAESESTNYVCNGNVRENSQTFNSGLYNKAGTVVGYPGPNSGVAAAASNPGPKIVSDVMVGGNRSPAIGPNYQSFVNAEDGVYGKGYAPLTVENNNMPVKMSDGSVAPLTVENNNMPVKMTGGKRRRRSKYSKKAKKHHKKSTTRHKRKSSNRRNKKSTKRRNRKSSKKRKTMKKKGMLTNLKKMIGMKGGNPSNFTSDTSVESDRQFLNNQEAGFTNSYTQGGQLSPLENALANPTLTTPTNNC